MGIPTIVSVAGWIVVFEQAASLKQRDDVSNLINNCKDVIDQIYKSCVDYYENNESHIGFISSDIRANFLLLSHYLMLIKSKGLEQRLEAYVVSYRKSIMGGYFETTDFKKQLEIPDRRAEISNARAELKFRIEKMHSDWVANHTLLSWPWKKRR